MESQVFRPYRVMGIVTNAIPIRKFAKDKRTFIVAGVGRSYVLYDDSDLRTKFISHQHPAEISVVCCNDTTVFTAADRTIYAWKEGQLIGTGRGHYLPVKYMCAVGNVVLSISDDYTLRVWPEKLGENHFTIQLSTKAKPTCLVHPDTYVNKVVVGYDDGSLEIWNFKTQKRIFSLKGWGSEITCMVQSPALDVLAIGLADGNLLLHNIRYDQTVTRFQQTDGAVTCLAFSKDQPLMASGSPSGQVNLWDLEKKISFSQISRAHDSGVTSIIFTDTHRSLITSGSDNTITLWKFEGDSEDAVVVKRRSGHHAPPHLVRFYDDGKTILSAGFDRSFRCFSVHKENCQELEQNVKFRKRKADGSAPPRLSVVTNLSWATNKEFDWDNIITSHENDPNAYLWELRHRSLGNGALVPSEPNAHTTAVGMSPCGNFCFVGTQIGSLDKFNIQSRQHRGTFKSDSEHHAHRTAVTGIVSDVINRTVISTSVDGDIKFWNFTTLALEHVISIQSAIRKIAYHKDSGFLAVSADDLMIRVYDVENRNLIRIFKGHTNRINDLSFSHDARLLVSVSNDTTARVWDLPTGKIIDCFCTSDIASSVSFSNHSEFIATTHAGQLGVFVWANKLHLRSSILKPVNEEDLTVIDLELFGGDISNENGMKIENTDSGLALSEKDQISPDLLTTSNLPSATWKMIANLEAIKERNKPKEAPKKPKLAPFFLSALLEPAAGPSNPFAVPATLASGSRIIQTKIQHANIKPRCKLSVELEKGSDGGDYSAAFKYLIELSPSAVELEFQELDPATDDLKWTIAMIRSILASNQNFEIIQAYTSLLLQIHREVLASNDTFVDDLRELLQQLKQAGARFQDLFQNSVCLLTHFADMQ